MKDPNHYANIYNAYDKNPKKIRILDSTLREGEQHPGVSFTNKQRIQIAWMLDYFGVDQIEISPVVSNDHKEATKTIIKQGLKADIVSHGRALKSDIDISLDCDAKWCAAYLGISDIHLKDKLRISREEALERAVETVEYAKSHGLKIRFTVEDGSRAEPEFLIKVCKAIEEAGVDRISLPDTVGILRPIGMYNFVKKVNEVVDVPLDAHVHNDIGFGRAEPEFLIKVCKAIEEAGVDRISLPDTVGILRPIGMYNFVKKVNEVVDVPLDAHVHNDIGFAVANAFSACDAGVDQIHTTIDGIGERTGIPPLAEIAVALTYLYKSPNDFRLDMLLDLSRLIEEYTSIKPYDSKPIVGSSAYKHKAGTY